MSDPVSSMDVEDVLSSIRRLVSEESKSADSRAETSQRPKPESRSPEEAAAAMLRGAPKSEAPEDASGTGTPPSNETVRDIDAVVRQFARPKPAETPRGDEKLVLTAALRVTEKQDDNPPSPAAEPVRPARPERLHLRPVADGARPTRDNHAEAEQDAARPPRARSFTFSPDEALFDRASRAMKADTEATQARIEDLDAEDFAPDVTDEAALAAPEAGSEEAVEADSQADAVVEPSEPPVALADDPEVAADEADPETADNTDSPSAEAPLRMSGVFGQRPPRVAAFYADPEETADQATAPETSAADPLGDTPDTALDDEDSTINFAEQDDSILDEDTLRDLVSQMVREELQGELGDRITRNVRKLVRREIQRALASREFE